jgi:photosystem II stability/assembly factor-like uncharacterized protein
MVRLLAGLVVLCLGAPALAGPLSRWTVSPPEGVIGLAVAGRTDSVLLAQKYDTSLVRSADGGKTWTPFSVPFRPWGSGFPSVAVGSPHDSRTWYLLGSDGKGRLTHDGGETWADVPIPIPTALVSFGATPQLLYAAGADTSGFGGYNGVSAQVSTDGGVTWRETGRYPRELSAPKLLASPSDARVVYVQGRNGVFRSGDGGDTWRDVTPPLPTPPLAPTLAALTVDGADPDVLYVHSFSLWDRTTWTSRDGGGTWVQAPLEWIVNTVADPLQRGRAYAFSHNATVYETRDAGLTWAVAEREARPVTSPADPAYPPSVVTFVQGRRIALNVAGGKVSSVDLTHGALALGSDLWWNPAESGAGLTITQHASNNPFVVWYTYDATGAPVWRVVPGGTWDDRAFSGDLYETTGPAYFGVPFDPARVASRKVGTATLRFDDESNATFTYEPASGARVEKRITRQAFAPPTPPTQDSVADLYWNPAESGWGIAINHQSSRIFATWYAYGDDGKPVWIVMPDAELRAEFAGAILSPAASGDIYTTRGPPEGTPFDPARVVSTKVGTARLFWYSQNSAYLEYTAFGRAETRTIRRQAF